MVCDCDAIFMTSCILIVTRYLLLPCGGRTRRPLHCHHFCVPHLISNNFWFVHQSSLSCGFKLYLWSHVYFYRQRDVKFLHEDFRTLFWSLVYIFCLHADCETVVGLWRGDVRCLLARVSNTNTNTNTALLFLIWNALFRRVSRGRSVTQAARWGLSHAACYIKNVTALYVQGCLNAWAINRMWLR
jgi:hypothetical protein